MKYDIILTIGMATNVSISRRAQLFIRFYHRIKTFQGICFCTLSNRSALSSLYSYAYCRSIYTKSVDVHVAHVTSTRSLSLVGNVASSYMPRNLADFQVLKRADRRLLRISGLDGAQFLQGLITNDMYKLEPESTCDCLYTMMLSLKGRVLWDLMIYRLPRQDTPVYLVEVHDLLSEQLMKMFKKYNIRRKVQIEEVSSELKVYSAFGCHKEIPQLVGGHVFLDPRLPELGWKLITSTELPESFNERAYKLLRYKLGVGEGPYEHLPDKSLPLECNLVFLNGVSFSKGCYLGQELTARSHHTGVIRKRIMPICLSESVELPQDCDIICGKTEKKVGTVRATEDRYGIALLRVAEALKTNSLYTTASGRKINISTHKPSWWPKNVLVE